MSDQWGSTEPNATGTGSYTGGNINISVPGMPEVAAGIKELTSNMQELRQVMAEFGQSQNRVSQGLTGTFNNVATSASSASESIKTFYQSLSGARPGGSSLATIFNYGAESGVINDAALFPLRYLQSTIGQNRQFSFDVGGALAGQQYATGMTTQQGIFGNLAKTFGRGGGVGSNMPTGTGQEITQFLQIARQAGAMMDLDRMGAGTMTGASGQNPRAPGFLTSAYQMQVMNPNMPLGQIGATLGGFVANTGAQRQGAYLTGGAYSMIGRGGKMKTIDEWAETIFRWLEGQRPGNKRGTGFTYDELISQQYPGSNIDAWFEANGVPPDMREVWWNYALAKARVVPGATTQSGFKIESGLPVGTPNMARSRLATTRPMTETSLSLASTLGGAYQNREQVNAAFNRQVGSLQKALVPGVLNGPLAFTSSLPDPLEELLMSIIERTGMAGAAIGGGLGWGSLATGGAGALIENLFGVSKENLRTGGGTLFEGVDPKAFDDIQSWLTGAIGNFINPWEGGDVGDVGWGPTGATTTSSLHPSMNAKVSAMMKANPRLRLNSGRRDEVTQRRLRGKGYSRVSGKSSAHTRGLAADIGPSSQYKWLAANASKFGLKSGVGEGEPWHVGMPGIGDIGDDAPKGFGSLLGLFQGGGGADPTAAIQGGLGGLFNLMFGAFASPEVAGKTADLANKNLTYDPDFASKLFDAATYRTGGSYGPGNVFDKILEAAKARNAKLYGSAADALTDGVTSTGAETLSGALQALGLASTGLSNGAMVALLANKAGFTGQDLVTAVAIAGRESGFDPKAHRSDVDKSLMRGDRGLWQINAGAWNNTLIDQGFIKDPLDQAIFDPWVNAQIARMIYLRANNFGAWSLDAAGRSGDHLAGTDVTAAAQYVHEAGLGDIESAPSTSRMIAVGGGGNVSFNNTFVVQGGGGGIDTRRIVNMLAQQLEGEMRRRMSRSN